MAPKSAYIGSLSPEYALLGLLAQKPAHGYELHQRLETDLGQVWHISQSQIYAILNRLVTNGYIQGELQEQEKLPARRRFRLTPSGRERFENWLHASSGCSVRAIRVEFTTRLYFAHLHGDELTSQMIENQIAVTRRCLERLNARLADTPREQTFNRIGLELRVRQLASMIEWMEGCRELL